MTDNFNIRDFRNAGQPDGAASSKKSNRGFYTCVIAIPVIAALAGVGYKPVMEMRTQNVTAAQMAEAQIRQDSETSIFPEGHYIDPKTPISGTPSNTRNEFANLKLTAREYLNREDAKAFGYTPLELETLKFTRAKWALQACEFRDLQKYYVQSNEGKYLALKAEVDKAKAAKIQAKSAEFEQLEIPKIENKTQALAFIASGGVARHQKAAMNAFGSMSGFSADMKKFDVVRKSPNLDKRGCMQVRTIIQSGAMNVKAATRLH